MLASHSHRTVLAALVWLESLWSTQCLGLLLGQCVWDTVFETQSMNTLFSATWVHMKLRPSAAERALDDQQTTTHRCRPSPYFGDTLQRSGFSTRRLMMSANNCERKQKFSQNRNEWHTRSEVKTGSTRRRYRSVIEADTVSFQIISFEFPHL